MLKINRTQLNILLNVIIISLLLLPITISIAIAQDKVPTVTEQTDTQKVKVGILPFQINAPSNMDYLKKSLPSMLSENLKNEGAGTILMDLADVQSTALRDKFLNARIGDYLEQGEIQKIGLEKGVDYLVWGSLFIAGGQISIDAKVFNVVTSEPPVSFSGRAGAVENLFGAVNKISKEIGSEIFDRLLVSDVLIQGNKRIESDAVLRVVGVKKGDIFNAEALSKELKKVFAMGYFEDVRVDGKELDNGIVVIFNVSEKPSVRKIKFQGNHIYEDKEIQEVVQTGTGSILNAFKINEDIERIKTLYTDKNYHNCEITFTPKMLENNQADITLEIKEGEKLKIKTIEFDGNKFFKAKALKKVMKTDEKGFFSWITSSGELKRNELEQDVYRLESFYKDNGFIDAKISDPEVEFKKESIAVKFKIQEGRQFKFGKISFSGDLIVSEKELNKKLTIKASDLYSREKLRTNVFAITDIYSDRGFANADISPGIAKNDETKIVDINFSITKGSPVYLERILISGNTKTRDKVIRRQLEVYEQDLYSMSKIQKSVRNLRRIDYFENVDIKTSKGSSDDKLNIDVEITEKATGAFSFGGGYSSEDQLFGMISVSERNLFGRGQTISTKAEVSATSARYTISFTEPWLFDIPLSAGVDLYNWDKEYDYYDKDSKGGAVRFGYRIFDDTSFGVRYGYEDFTIENVQDIYTEVDPGQYITSSITTTLRYDSTNAMFNPTEGSDHSISVEYAGDWLGGEIEFTKYIAETGWYYPLFWKFTGFLHGKTGFLDDRAEGIEIDYERFYLGGINSVRGYDWQDINATPEGELEQRGGEKFIQFNAEVIFPIVEDINLAGVIFFDAGDSYLKDEDFALDELYTSYGGGFRWYSPMGPIRIEYGKILDGKEYSGGRWEFSMGGAF
ncbi:MAG: outer membrane protein assembly factor BamA [Desulfamplus sp.]|nr:outer membrane protein assembly factor BamA [Desulfamplus sp.]